MFVVLVENPGHQSRGPDAAETVVPFQQQCFSASARRRTRRRDARRAASAYYDFKFAADGQSPFRFRDSLHFSILAVVLFAIL